MRSLVLSLALVSASLPPLPPPSGGMAQQHVFQFEMVAPDMVDGQPITIAAAIHADQPDSHGPAQSTSINTPVFRTFRITNTADSGTGSLREAINSANASCTDKYPCKIEFVIPDPPIDGVQTIRPETPLPHLQGTNLVVDAVMQTTLFGDSNPAGPEVQLLGDRLRDGEGLVVETTCKFITATATKSDYFGFARTGRLSPDNSWQGFVTTTSEVSRAIPVE